MEKFQELFLITDDTIQENDDEDDDPITWMALEKNSTVQIGIGNLAFSEDQKQQETLLCLPSYFRLVQSCESFNGAEQDELEGTEPMLAIPIQMFEKSKIRSFSGISEKSERRSVVLSLFHAVNW